MIFDLNCFNVLSLTQTVKTSPIYVNVEDVIVLTETVTKNIRTRAVKDHFTLTDNVSVSRSIVNLSVSDTLNFNQNGQKTALETSAYDGLFFWQEAKIVEWDQVSEQLVFIQDVQVTSSKGTNTTFAITQSVSLIVVRSIIITDILTFGNNVNTFNSKLGADFILPVVDPVTTKNANVTFQFGTFNFTVHAPDFSDTETLEFSRMNRRSRGGDLIIFRDPMWPESITLKMTFSYLKETEKIKFQSLFVSSLGQQITYTDHFGQNWIGIILNPQSEVIQTGRGQWKVSIELQGSKI